MHAAVRGVKGWWIGSQFRDWLSPLIRDMHYCCARQGFARFEFVCKCTAAYFTYSLGVRCDVRPRFAANADRLVSIDTATHLAAFQIYYFLTVSGPGGDEVGGRRRALIVPVFGGAICLVAGCVRVALFEVKVTRKFFSAVCSARS